MSRVGLEETKMGATGAWALLVVLLAAQPLALAQGRRGEAQLCGNGRLDERPMVVGVHCGPPSMPCCPTHAMVREACDGTALGGASCRSLGYAAGALRCDSACRLDESECTLCQSHGGVQCLPASVPGGTSLVGAASRGELGLAWVETSGRVVFARVTDSGRGVQVGAPFGGGGGGGGLALVATPTGWLFAGPEAYPTGGTRIWELLTDGTVRDTGQVARNHSPIWLTGPADRFVLADTTAVSTSEVRVVDGHGEPSSLAEGSVLHGVDHELSTSVLAYQAHDELVVAWAGQQFNATRRASGVEMRFEAVDPFVVELAQARIVMERPVAGWRDRIELAGGARVFEGAWPRPGAVFAPNAGVPIIADTGSSRLAAVMARVGSGPPLLWLARLPALAGQRRSTPTSP